MPVAKQPAPIGISEEKLLQFLKDAFSKLNQLSSIDAQTIGFSNFDGVTKELVVVVPENTVEFENSWEDYDTETFPGAQFERAATGRVHIEGLVKSGTVSNVPASGTIFVLPEGFRPSSTLIFPQVSSNAGITEVSECRITPDGEVYAHEGSNTWFNLTGISFVPEPTPPSPFPAYVPVEKRAVYASILRVLDYTTDLPVDTAYNLRWAPCTRGGATHVKLLGIDGLPAGRSYRVILQIFYK